MDYVQQYVRFATQHALQQLDCKHTAKLCSWCTSAGLVTAECSVLLCVCRDHKAAMKQRVKPYAGYRTPQEARTA